MANINNEKKSSQLGMPIGTAANRLRKLVLFDLLQRHGENVCFQCNRKIEFAEELSVEHKVPWLGEDNSLYWDLNNIAFSHLSCNSAAGRKYKTAVHGTCSMYKSQKCRCDLCRKANALYQRTGETSLP